MQRKNRRNRTVLAVLCCMLVFAAGQPLLVSAAQDFEESGSAAPFLWTGEIYDSPVTNGEEALNAVYGALEEIGEDNRIQLGDASVINGADGMVYYTFSQINDGVPVFGAVVKLIVDSCGKAVALVSSLDHTDPERESGWREQAGPGINEESFRDTAVGEANVAHTGTSANHVLSRLSEMETDVYRGLYILEDGTELAVEVPVLCDKATGAQYLADPGRGIFCMDYAEYAKKNVLSLLSVHSAGTDADNLLIYRNFIRIYDFYRALGWEGPDGRGNPSLLMLHLADSEGLPAKNAYYQGFYGGFQVFAFGKGYGACLDVIGHEFTHCVSESAMTCSLYADEYGAINEGISDIMGNLAEMTTEKSEEGYWLIGENSGAVMRSMGDPNLYEQPAYIWDQYYVPDCKDANDFNDYGGVHSNSSLLNILSYDLYEAGMSVQEQCVFWMHVICSITPQTGFDQLTELLPWCLETSGNAKYATALTEAMTKAGYLSGPQEETVTAGNGFLSFVLPEDLDFANYILTVHIKDPAADGKEYVTWPEAGSNRVVAAVEDGQYYIVLALVDRSSGNDTYLIAGQETWVPIPRQSLRGLLREPDEAYLFPVSSGTVTSLCAADIK